MAAAMSARLATQQLPHLAPDALGVPSKHCHPLHAMVARRMLKRQLPCQRAWPPSSCPIWRLMPLGSLQSTAIPCMPWLPEGW